MCRLCWSGQGRFIVLFKNSFVQQHDPLEYLLTNDINVSICDILIFVRFVTKGGYISKSSTIHQRQFFSNANIFYSKMYRASFHCITQCVANIGTSSFQGKCIFKKKKKIITITFMARKPLLSETENQPEISLLGRGRSPRPSNVRGLVSRFQNVVFAMKDIFFLYFLEKRNSREPYFVSDLPFVPHFLLI